MVFTSYVIDVYTLSSNICIILKNIVILPNQYFYIFADIIFFTSI